MRCSVLFYIFMCVALKVAKKKKILAITRDREEYAVISWTSGGYYTTTCRGLPRTYG